jgi:hypothetical protein
MPALVNIGIGILVGVVLCIIVIWQLGYFDTKCTTPPTDETFYGHLASPHGDASMRQCLVANDPRGRMPHFNKCNYV